MTFSATDIDTLRELTRQAIRERWSVFEMLRTIGELPDGVRDAARVVLGHMLIDELDARRVEDMRHR